MSAVAVRRANRRAAHRRSARPGRGARCWANVRFAHKILRGATAGYTGLQWQDGEKQWHDIACDPATGKWEDADLPYYVCVSWANWTHTPLPIILQWGQPQYPLQNWVVRILDRLGWPAMRTAMAACRSYEKQVDG
ncbi:MAG: hypothetical protein KKA73_24540 [Chloroflexi bacterium]|nr:hypothetical protein [Chloroflexota bacterium]